jgi:colicin import membrane protein
MAEQKESSVLFSLKELMHIEENRIKEEQDSKRKAAEQELQAKAEAERLAREQEAARLAEEEERRRADEQRRRMEEAQVEAAKAAEIEKRRLEDQHRLEMQALAAKQAHEKEVAEIHAKTKKGPPMALLAIFGVIAAGLLAAIIFFVAIKPATEAKEAVKKAQTLAASDDDKDWDEAENQIAIAKSKDPSNKDVVAVEEKVHKKRQDAQDKADAEKKKLADEKKSAEEKLIALRKELDEAQTALAKAGTDEEKKKAQERIAAAQAAMRGGGGGGGGAKPKPACPPGVPLCN